MKWCLCDRLERSMVDKITHPVPGELQLVNDPEISFMMLLHAFPTFRIICSRMATGVGIPYTLPRQRASASVADG